MGGKNRNLCSKDQATIHLMLLVQILIYPPKEKKKLPKLVEKGRGEEGGTKKQTISKSEKIYKCKFGS